ncbi:four-carbon acid sugar kinase family protein [Candidatus Bathyarchaeota archaeon]|nr:four-carbon acid sugar kinase family protein [Candidatus Bathyarchaeota archaeon]
MAKIGVIADDLTGANDTGVQFSKQGLRTIVLTRGRDLEDVSDQVDVLVIDTESRSLPAAAAYERAREAASRLVEAKIPIVYKKIDSTLKGNIGAELDGVMDGAGYETAIVAPAFPANKRVTVGGYQLVNMIPLGRTEAARDPVTPVRESHVPTLIASQSKRRIEHIGLAAVMDLSTLKNEMREYIRKGGGVIVVDSVTQNDLRRVAHAASSLGIHVLTCGPAGLAEELPEAFGLILGRPVVVVSGSVSEVTMRQIAAAESSGSIVVTLDASKILDGDRVGEVRRIVEVAKRHISEGCDVIVSSARSKEAVSEDLKRGESRGMSSIQVSEVIGSVLGEIACELAESQKIAGLILTGGTTAIQALQSMGMLGTEVDDEVCPGIPSAVIIGGRNAGLRIVTKAGGFGEDDAIMKSIRYLKMRGGK